MIIEPGPPEGVALAMSWSLWPWVPYCPGSRRFRVGFTAAVGDDGAAATQRRTRSAHGALAETGAKGGGGASLCAVASTCLASASSIQRNGIGFRIGLLPGAVVDPHGDIVATRCYGRL